MDFFIDIIESTTMFLETKGKFFMSINNKDEEKNSIENIISLVKKGKIKESRIDKSVKRIIKLKQKYNLADEFETTGINIEQINDKIQEIRKKCNME